MTEETRLKGLRILVVEDDFLIADDLSRALEACGAEVWGPVADVAGALDLLARGVPDLAALDLNLGGAMAYPVADRLRALGVPFLFSTGYDAASIDEAYRDAPRSEKPNDAVAHLAALAKRRDG